MRDLNRREKLESAAKAAGVLQNLEFHALDVTNAKQIAALADEIGQRLTPLDAHRQQCRVCAPGFADDITDAELREQFETNFFGATAVTRAFLPQLRRKARDTS